MTLKAVIFDVDGTLAETEELHRRAFNEAFARHGHDWFWDADLYRQLLRVEGGRARIRAYVEARHPRDLAALEHAGAFEAIHAAKSEIYLTLIEEGAQLRPGVARLIAEARSTGLRVAACTSSLRANFEGLIVAALGFEALDAFSVVVTSEDVTALKPDPAPYLLALERLGLGPDAAIVIEDNARGVASARAAGLGVIASPGLYSRDDAHEGALLTLSDLGEPQAPFEVLAGDPGPFSHVSTEALRFWHDRAGRGRGAAA